MEKNGMQKKIPIIHAWREGRQLIFWCPYCRKEHYHGLGDGHRAAHCFRESPYRETGYILEEV